MDVVECMTGKSPPQGTCVDVYKEDFGTSDGAVMMKEFVNFNLGAGRANSLAQCITAYCASCRIP
jgi:hypothetical protein